MQYLPLNLGLMANPVNWLIVTLMVLIGGFSVALLSTISPTQPRQPDA